MEQVSGTATHQPIPRVVKILGWVSLFTDLSSEMVYPLNPTFITRVLGAPPWVLGLIEGGAEACANLIRPFAGRLSDSSPTRKPLIAAGYAAGALSKPLLGIASVWPGALAARVLDRLGKGVRTPGRDALIAEATAPTQRGRAFGLHRAMDTCGALIGPLVGWLILRSFSGPTGEALNPHALRMLYIAAAIPGAVAVSVLLIAVRETRNPSATVSKAPNRSSWRSLNPQFRRFLGISILFGIGNSSDSFLLLRAGDSGLTPSTLLLMYVTFNAVEALLGYAAGRLSDRIGRGPLLAAGFAVFAIVYLGFALAHTVTAIWLLFMAYGLYYTLTQGVQRALAADLTSGDDRASHMGILQAAQGGAGLIASVTAGYMYGSISHAAPFFMGAATASISAAAMVVFFAHPLLDRS